MRILVVDDELTSRSALEYNARKLGYEVLSATDGDAAWEIWKKERPSIVISDWLMPGMDGLELCRKIRKHEKRRYTYFIIVTVKNSEDDLVTGMQAGADDYVTKPVRKEEFSMRLRAGERVISLQNEVCTMNEELEERVQERTALLESAYHQLEESTARAQKLTLEAQAAIKAKNQFLANISHEIRTPMNGIIGMTSILMNAKLNEEQRDYAETIRISSDYLLSLINNILDFSKLEAGELDLVNETLALDGLVADVTKMLEIGAKKKNLNLRVEIDADVPLQLNADADRLKQILINLTGNAIKFTERGDIVIRAKKKMETATDVTLCFSVTDSGIGIPSEHFKILFKNFSRVDNSMTRKQGGAGLGLAISKELTRLMGGEIGVSSEVGKGSTFWFRLTLNKIEKAKVVNGVDVNSIDSNSTVTAKKKYRILLAEDNFVNRKLALKILEKLGYYAEAVVDGVKVLEALTEEEYDLVLMDVQMPEMDGLEATRNIRDPEAQVTNHHIPIVALTAHAMKGDREKCLAAGMDDYISKPVKPEKLSEVIAYWLEKRESRQ